MEGGAGEADKNQEEEEKWLTTPPPPVTEGLLGGFPLWTCIHQGFLLHRPVRVDSPPPTPPWKRLRLLLFIVFINLFIW